MQAAVSDASAMPPSSDCSAERRDFNIWLRMASGHPAPALRRQAIMTVSGNNVALLTDCILAAFKARRYGAARYAASQSACVAAVRRVRNTRLTIAERALLTT